ncbi:hypothetical protein BF95_11125 [Sphingobium sp. Ant17]|nr:hypothetical protein BF95_11125 [Sphingobium sp. Ant17]
MGFASHNRRRPKEFRFNADWQDGGLSGGVEHGLVATGAARVGQILAAGHGEPCGFSAQAAVADIVEGGGVGVGARLAARVR